ncbi:rhodanese-like domain-containing protein [Aliishimia ponticola]|uniref:Rhodanese-like domain-containing protein n=1 Tax=Aliishimia ponticola TaxID=2499833 RepID=A0A4S4N9Q0_9RHOB|nr:rhodanese-like domain-containing protein [Aliishimia ponticola]THH35984.1 rhodanese-like domain-containing protein [Aliishimia ponticola]
MTQNPTSAGPDGSPHNPKPPSRRRILALGAVAAVGVGVLGARWFNIGASVTQAGLSVEDAHAMATRRDITLIDIRRPDEWARTGIGAGAHPIDMRRADFAGAVLTLVGGDAHAPIAVICARGVRSRRLAQRMAEAGFTRVLDVPEGMLGSGAGQGWLRKGLPVVRL